MYYYISFLRPPPTSSTPNANGGASISITPQIANDLRTEFFVNTQDIYYRWLRSAPAPVTATPPTKLTTWRGETSAYKSISVPLPQGVREKDSWRLVLTTSPNDPGVIALGATNAPKKPSLPYPVASLPISFISCSSEAVKQEQIERRYAIYLDNTPLMMVIREHTSFDLDKKIWDSGIGTSSWLVDLCVDKDTNQVHSGLKNRLLRNDKINVVELGTGTGILSLVLAAIRSKLGLQPAQVLATDLPSAVPLLEHNFSANAGLFSTPAASPKALVLDWDQKGLPLEVAEITNIDIIMMADIAYNTASFPALVSTLKSLAAMHAPESQPLVLLGYKKRDPSEKELWDMLESEAGIRLTQIGTEAGMGGEAVEIWVSFST